MGIPCCWCSCWWGKFRYWGYGRPSRNRWININWSHVAKVGALGAATKGAVSPTTAIKGAILPVATGIALGVSGYLERK